MKSKAIFLVLLLAILMASGCARSAAETAAAALVPLPAAKTDGTFAVEKALQQRRSLRDPAPTPLTPAEIGQLCWAAQGVTDSSGHRTAPSAMARYPLELYVLAGEVSGFAPGVYRYKPDKHALELVAAGDARASFQQKACRQGWIAKAPVIFVITGIAERMGSMGDRGHDFMWAEAGLAAQGFFLQATALGMGSTYVGGFDPNGARSALGLPSGQEVMAVLPVGRKSL